MMARAAAAARIARWSLWHWPTMTLREAAAVARRLYRPLWLATLVLVPMILII